ncbi:P-loop NTPase fold protein [Oscillatoria sp. FACHB-1406]|uniref:AAA family ATPase n=1 Tax=Oscillatoria sp. FACHB-1406 TaxID=2692846 RepID=UPI001687DADD|nr:P-loop NTPase fold protein [Oscillatoria sp. FACHB-1406]MBD2578707.1 AAA family ATPase [Oscillatoria sp. FACHB-1406]
MTSSPQSIDEALRDRNPFAKPPYVNAKDIWGQDFFDVESVNAHASDAVFQALKQIRDGLYSTTSIAITAQDGTGKTHIISRIRHQLQSENGGLFVYANKYSNLINIKHSFQQILAESLGQIGHQGVTQWQELATAMTNHILNHKNPNTTAYSVTDLLEKFKTSEPNQANQWIERLSGLYCNLKAIEDPDIVRAVFLTLSPEASYAVKWLKGQELSQAKAAELQLPTQNQSFEAVLQILDLISEYQELVICFDELDQPNAQDEEIGLHLSQIIACLVKDLLQNLNRGVILTVMMPAQWTNKIKQLPNQIHNKVSAQGEPLKLSYIDRNSVIGFVTLWLKKYYERENLTPSSPLYPFEEKELLSLADDKPTVRELLKWCRVNCDPKKQKADPVETAFIAELDLDFDSIIDDNNLLADALYFGFKTLIGKTIERIIVTEVTDGVFPKGGRDSYLNFKILGKEGDKNVSIGVSVLQYAGRKALGAGLRRLIDYEQFELTRGCLVRSKAKKITTYLEQKYLEPLIRQQGGEFVELKEAEIKPLLAIRAVHNKREVDYGLSEEQIETFIAEKGAELMLGESNPLLQEILSDPSYDVPTDLIEDEPILVAESIRDDFSISDDNDLDNTLNDLRNQFNIPRN